MATQRRSVYPVAGRWLSGIPAAHLIVDSDVATRLVRTGAFTREGAGDDSEPLELTEEQLASFDTFDNVPAEEPASEEPAPAAGEEESAPRGTKAKADKPG